jgi:hypothetical protein
MVKGYLPCFPFAAAQSLLPYSLESSRAMKRLNNNDRKQVIQTIKKQYTNHDLNAQQIVLKDSTHHYE